MLPRSSRPSNQPRSHLALGSLVAVSLLLVAGAAVFPDQWRWLLGSAAVLLVGALLWAAIQRRGGTRQALAADEIHYRAIFDYAADAILVVDAITGVIVEANACAARLTGRAPEVLRGLDRRDLHPPEEHDGLLQVMAMGGDVPGRVFAGLHILDATGERIPVELVFGGAMTQGGRPLVIYMLRDLRERLRDEAAIHELNATLELRVQTRTADLHRANQQLQEEIVERERAEQQLRESEEQYRILVEQSLQVVMILQDAKLVFANPALANLSGYSLEELQGLEFESILALLHPDDRLLMAQRIRARLAKEDLPSRVEVRFVHRDGRLRWVTMAVNLIQYRGKPAIQGVAVDITALKEADEDLRTSRDRLDALNSQLLATNLELTRAMRLKDEFLATMSHELRTPLNNILGRSEAIRDGVYGLVTPGQQQALHSLGESGRHLLALISDILDLSRIEAGQFDLVLEPVVVEDLCRSVVGMVAHSATTRYQHMSIDRDPAVVMIEADARRLKQILINLLSNAVKFTPEQGTISLVVQGDHEARLVRFIVSDTGIGIAKEHLSKLGQPFMQIASGLDRPYEGTGLGLALVFRLVRLHGGDLTVESEPGVGSRFIVTLPWRETCVLRSASSRAAAGERGPASS